VNFPNHSHNQTEGQMGKLKEEGFQKLSFESFDHGLK
jgi:hypothetical protein